MANWLFWPVNTVPQHMAINTANRFVLNHLDIWTGVELTALNREGNLGGFLCETAHRNITARCIPAKEYFKKQDCTVNIYICHTVTFLFKRFLVSLPRLP